MSSATVSPRATAIALALISCCAPTAALADHWALTVEAGAGPGILTLPAPYAAGSPATLGTNVTAWLGGRYALRDNFELGASAFFEPPVSYFHNGVTVATDAGPLSGTLSHRFMRYGAMAGPRFVTGMVWRFVAGLELGWSHRAYSNFDLIDDSIPGQQRSYGLTLPDKGVDNFVLSPLLGLEWTLSDHAVLAITPRAQFMLGPEATVAIIVPITLGWSWYL